MAKKFKDYYDDQYLELLIKKLAPFSDIFNQEVFISATKGNLDDLEFMARVDLIARALEHSTLLDYTETIERLGNRLGPKLKQNTGMFTEGWWLWPIGRFIENDCHQDFKASMNFIYELTQRFTGEFAIRPLLEEYPSKTMKTLLKWSLDESVHVRRLASEAIRPKLPWAKKVTIQLESFDLYFKILDNLKNAPEKFIQKSVANNLNDLFKIDKKLAHKIIEAWQNDELSEEAQWIIKHGTRSLRKKIIFPRILAASYPLVILSKQESNGNTCHNSALRHSCAGRNIPVTYVTLSLNLTPTPSSS